MNEKENVSGTKRKDISEVSTPNKKSKRSIIEYKNKLQFKQKPINLSKNTNYLQSLLEFHQYLTTLDTNLAVIPTDFHKLITTLTHESDKSIIDLVKSIKSQIKPSNYSHDVENKSIESAVSQVADHVNYGLDGDSLPPSLKLYKWEAKNFDDLPSDTVQTFKQRRSDREYSKQKLLEMVEGVESKDLETILSSSSAQTPSSLKQEEKRRKDEEKAQEKRRKEEEKAEEKRKKEEEKALEKQKKEQEKAQEKERKDHEKNMKEQEKKEAQQQAQQLKQKQSNAFKGFFSKVPTPKKSASPTKDVSDFHKTFKPFHLKQGFDMAPINNFKPPQYEDLWDVIDKSSADDVSLSSSLSDIPKWKLIKRSPAVANKKAPPNSKIAPPVDLRMVMQLLSEAEVGGDENKATEILESFKTRFRGKVKNKLLKYHEDYRPGWWGTCTKSSSTVGPRRPFAQDALQFDYSYDSEVEWGEEEADEKGEEIQSQAGSDDEKDKEKDPDNDNDSDVDSWLVSDSEDVGLEDMDLDNINIPPDLLKTDDPIDNAIAAEKRNERAKAKKKNNKSKKPNQPSKPYVSGLKWESDDGQITYAPFFSYQIRFLNDANISINPKEFTSQFKPTLVTQNANANANAEGDAAAAASSTTATAVHNTFKTPSKDGSKVTSIPETHIPIFLQVVDNSTKSRVLLVEELRERFSHMENGPKISKAAIESMLASNARREGRKVNSQWHVSENVKQRVTVHRSSFTRSFLSILDLDAVMDASGVFGNDYITNKETLLDFDDDKEGTSRVMLPTLSHGVDKDRPKLLNPDEEHGNEEVIKPHLKDLLKMMLVANVD
ncbi:hypothetical protein E3P99_01230 [Wallemia hederae]|uniref:Uncharacterized protein n=1 Tax=Wallemia hederae TaxID=1540922 RepID=A0A4T0FQS6_9BASI|nr:hypothetical protein E3P99_01230 [Wallemia hederae]